MWVGLLTDRIDNKLERSNLINEHALNRVPVPLRFEHLCSLKNFCEEVKVVLRFNTVLSKDEIGNWRLISRHIYSKSSDWETWH